MWLFKPIKLKKIPIMWYTYSYGGMYINIFKPTRKFNRQIITEVKHTAITQPLYWFPFNVSIKLLKNRLAVSLSGKMIKDLCHIYLWKKDKIIFVLYKQIYF